MTSMGITSKPIGGGGTNVSNSEINKMESKISELKAQVASKDKEIRSLTSRYEALND